MFEKFDSVYCSVLNYISPIDKTVIDKTTVGVGTRARVHIWVQKHARDVYKSLQIEKQRMCEVLQQHGMSEEELQVRKRREEE